MINPQSFVIHVVALEGVFVFILFDVTNRVNMFIQY